jgi:hypothetical protein
MNCSQSCLICHAFLVVSFHSWIVSGACLSASVAILGSNPHEKYPCNTMLLGNPACEARTENLLMYSEGQKGCNVCKSLKDAVIA